MRVFLVGSMGAGKSTTGRALARRLGALFCDLDRRVEAQESIEGVEHRRLRCSGGRGGELRLERIACDGRRLQHQPFLLREQRELVAERRWSYSLPPRPLFAAITAIALIVIMAATTARIATSIAPSRPDLSSRAATERAAARGHEAVDERTNRQLRQQEKAERATYAVHNSGSLKELEHKLSDVLGKLSQ